MNESKIKLTLDSGKLTLLCWALLVLPVVLYVIINIYYSGFQKIQEDFTGTNSLQIISILLLTYLAHEFLHLVGGVLAGAKTKSITFGFDKSNLSITCACNDEISVLGMKLFLLTPFVVLTSILLALALTNASAPWWLVLALSSSGCAFDLTVVAGLKGIPNKTRVIPELSGENGHVYLKGA